MALPADPTQAHSGPLAPGAAQKPSQPAPKRAQRSEKLSGDGGACPITRDDAISLQHDLKAGFAVEAFQLQLKDLEGRHCTRTPAYLKERSALFMTVQSVVLPKYGFTGNVAGLLKLMVALKAFFSDPEYVRIANENCRLLGLYEQLLPEPPEPAASAASARKFAGAGPDEESLDSARALLAGTLHVYYMNVDPTISGSSQLRQRIQEEINPLVAAGGGYLFIPRRVCAVTPDSVQWKAAKAEYGCLVMESGGEDSWSGAAASCILLSFRQALLHAAEEAKMPNSPAFVIITEDDMMLVSGFAAVLEAAVAELREDPVALGAMLHSSSLAENMLQSVSRRPVLRPVWPRYPMKPVVKKWHSTTWPGQPVIPDQPLVALLRSERLQEFIALYDDRLRYSGWSPLDWLLANAPFGESGKLRLTARNGFCRGGAAVSADSVRCEQHKAVAEGRGGPPREARFRQW
uniref:Protein C10 n=1 Tax=Alexandrium monilatum TaxID=311494 RepID=A0A7S4S357_9DINO